MKLRLLSFVLLVLFCASGPNCQKQQSIPPIDPAPLPPGPDSITAVTPSVASAQAQFVTSVNNYRQQAGYSALTVDPTVQSVAQAQSDYNLANQILTRVRNGQSPKQQLIAAGLTIGKNGESEVNTYGYKDAQSVFNFFISDPGYPPIIKTNYWTKIGVGISVNAGSGQTMGDFWTIIFTK